MTTLFPFVPSNVAPFQFQPTFDGAHYTCTIKQNFFGQRYYVFCTDLSGNPIFTRPLIGSPPTYNINLLAGYFVTSTMVYRVSTGNFEVDPPTPPPLDFPPVSPTPNAQYFINNGGVLMIGNARGYPISTAELATGAIWNNGGVVQIFGSTTPDPAAPPVYFGTITPQQLLRLGGSNIPTSAPASGTLQLWNNGGVVMVA